MIFSAQSPRNLTLAIALKKHAKVDIKLFFSYPILLDFSAVVKYFAWDCRYHDLKLTSEEHYKSVFSKTNRTMGHLVKLLNLQPREALTIYKALD